jgi:predicted phage terminase large subunit-like protein
LNKEQLAALDRLLCDGSLRDFIRQAWKLIEPGRRLVWNWHIDCVADHLEAVSKGQLRKLIINIPRRHLKSQSVSVFWPAWEWTRNPEARWLFGSHSLNLCVRDSRHCRQIVESNWYKSLWGNKFTLTSDQNQKTYFENDKKGFRLCRSVGASAIGQGGDFVVADDPHDPMEVQSDIQRQAVLDWWDGVMSASVVDPEKSAHVLIMQRVHHQDLTGHLIEQGGYEVLSLPTEFIPERKCSTSIGFSDPRTERSELLFPKRFKQEYIDSQKISLGSYKFAGQHQQNPSPQEGGLAKRHWWRFWYYPGNPLPPPPPFQLADGTFVTSHCSPLPTQGENGSSKPHFDSLIQSWDMAFKDDPSGSFVVGQVWGSKGADRFLMDQDRRQIDFSATLEAVRNLTKRWPDALQKLVEDKANGPAVISALRHEIGGIVEVEPQGGKEARAQAVLPAIESGNVYLPHPAIAPWVNDYIEEWAAAPHGDYWDQIDSTSQALIRLQQRKVFFFT